MQDPNADTQWNDALRAKGIIPEKPSVELTEQDIISIVDKTVQEQNERKQYSAMGRGELDELEDEVDEEEERIFEMYRRQRLLEMKETQAKNCYGSVGEISKVDYVSEVNNAGPDVWVVLHVYKQGFPLCSLIDNHMRMLALKFPATKFLRSEVSVCIPNYPDHNLPTVFVYSGGKLVKQFVGPLVFGGMRLTCDELEWVLADAGAVKTTLESNPRQQVHDVMSSCIRGGGAANRDSDDDD